MPNPDGDRKVVMYENQTPELDSCFKLNMHHFECPPRHVKPNQARKEAKSLLFVTIWMDGIKKGSFVFVLIKRTSKHFFHTRIIF